jgi:hypothetical protein
MGSERRRRRRRRRRRYILDMGQPASALAG